MFCRQAESKWEEETFWKPIQGPDPAVHLRDDTLVGSSDSSNPSIPKPCPLDAYHDSTLGTVEESPA